MNDLFESATKLRDRGMKRAKDNADTRVNEWAEKAYGCLCRFITRRLAPFMAEDVRLWAESNQLSNPPSKRAWGAIIVRAAREGLIERIGYQETTNPLAHRTPATLWIVVQHN